MQEDETRTKQTSPESLILENQLCFPLYAASRKVISLYTPYFKPLGITYTQYIVFLVLWEEHCVSVRSLCQKLCLDSGTLTPLLKKMEDAGYVTRSRSEKDERVVIITLTPEGEALREKALEIPERVGSCIPLSTGEAVTLYQLLYKILNSTQNP